MWCFIAKNEDSYKKLRENLRKFKSVFQYVYSIFYPEIYCSTEKRGFDLKSQFLVLLKECKNQEKDGLEKDPRSYENRENSKFEEQKSILVDDFTKKEEEALRQKSEARKRKKTRCEKARRK